MKAITEKLTTSFGQSVDVPLTGWTLDQDKTRKRGGANLYFTNDITGDRKISHGGAAWLPYDMACDMAWLAETDGIGIVHRALGTDIYTKGDLAHEKIYATPKA